MLGKLPPLVRRFLAFFETRLKPGLRPATLQAEADQGTGGLSILEEIVAELHALRLRLAAPGQVIDEADTRRYVHLVIVVAFGDALIGPRLRAARSPAEEATAREGFERWFVDLVRAS